MLALETSKIPALELVSRTANSNFELTRGNSTILKVSRENLLLSSFRVKTYSECEHQGNSNLIFLTAYEITT
jgi:hypothetical protein